MSELIFKHFKHKKSCTGTPEQLFVYKSQMPSFVNHLQSHNLILMYLCVSSFWLYIFTRSLTIKNAKNLQMSPYRILTCR
jgi:hypothetical protein